MVRFDPDPFLLSKKRIAKVKSAYNLLISGPSFCLDYFYSIMQHQCPGIGKESENG